MSIRNIYVAENWSKVYSAFENINFTSFDFDTIKESILQYVKLYYSESFNDFIESSEFIALIESFAYVAEQLSYRIDVMSHENFMPTAQRKASILKLAKLISYKITRNIPARGLVKIGSITTTERIIDSQGNNLAGRTINWNDANNTNWKEQFFLVMNRVLTGKFGQPQKVFQVDDVAMQLYSFNNATTSFTNGVSTFTVDTGLETFPMEVVPSDLNENGPFERAPDINSTMSLIYALDGIGDGSDYTGFLMFVKQGNLVRTEYVFDSSIPNRTLELSLDNINQTDVWLNKVDINGIIEERWDEVPNVSEQNLLFNTNTNRKKFEVETRENDKIRLLFGDGDFSDIPRGRVYIWTRQSINRSLVIQKNKLINQQMAFTYTSALGLVESCAVTFSATSTIQNSAPSETIEHVRQSAPATYYAQDRMVNAQDYNTYMLKDSSILRINTVNRTFAGQPKYIDWNDASGAYENVKLFGDDLVLKYFPSVITLNSTVSSKSLIDSVIEPLLSTTGVINTLIHLSATDSFTQGVVSSPRRKFIENNIYKGVGSPLLEKTLIQGALDRHYYGDPIEYVTIAGTIYAKVPDSTAVGETDDGKIYQDTIPLTTDGINPATSPAFSGLQPLAAQPLFGLKFIRSGPMIGTGSLTGFSVSTYATEAEVITIEVAGDGATLFVSSNVSGRIFANGTINIQYSTIDPNAAIDFIVSGTLVPGDAFVVRISTLHVIDPVVSRNLNGQWEIINGTTLGGNYEDALALGYDPTVDKNSWLILVHANTSSGGIITGFDVSYREIKLIASSENTNFWYNSSVQLLDAQTKNVVYDTIRILGSNWPKTTLNTRHPNENYDVIGSVKDNDGVINRKSLEIIPSDALKLPTSGNTMPDSILQFEQFANGQYQYFNIADTEQLNPITLPVGITFNQGAIADSTDQYTRTLYVSGLDFMWQHFSPHTNLIDPSVSNIHDVFMLTRGYYDNITSYLLGKSTTVPVPPTPLELRNSYGYLLNNKMLSDTVILHSGKIKLLFGDLAEPQLRAHFKVIKAPMASLTGEKIKSVILDVINTYFSIENWDFGETFYVTELLGLIHQRLPTEISSVVLVPQYSVNSFGSLFTVQSGFDEILQSAAKITDIEIVDAFTPTVLRQNI